MDILKRELAPLTPAAWSAVQTEARRALASTLAARTFVDVAGPKGIAFSAVGIGRLRLPEQPKDAAVRYGVHQVLPLVETRASFAVKVWDLDDIERGAVDPDLDAVTEAARELGRFEEQAIYEGLESAGIVGLIKAAKRKPLLVAADAETFAETLSKGALELRRAGIEGPFDLILGPELYAVLDQGEQDYPLRKHLKDITGGDLRLAPALTGAGGFLVSQRGGDFELTLGQDAAVGYEAHDASTVRLYLSESFTFRVLQADAYLVLVTKDAQ